MTLSSNKRSASSTLDTTLVTSKLALALGLVCGAGSLQAREVPLNLGYGLDVLVQDQVALQRGEVARFNGFTSQAAAEYTALAIRDVATNRVMVDITLSGKVAQDELKVALTKKISSLTITATDASYRGVGIIEGFVSVDQVAALSQTSGVRGVFLALRPSTGKAAESGVQTDSVPTQLADNANGIAKAADTNAPNVVPGGILNKLGTTFDQGVVQHGVDKINRLYNPSAPLNIDGTGISLGALSDSFDTRGTAPTAANSVTNGDLPGVGNTVNALPVVVLQDLATAGSDEGRGMVEILYKMAPKARLAFATAFLGEVSFANNVRALAALPGFTLPTQAGFKADVIVDDVSYGGEPFYGESIVGAAVDEVAAAGVSYFSSAGNNIGINAYESALRIVPNGSGLTAATNTALAGTNIDLATVPTSAYAGGFHNFNPVSGQLDVAQLVNMPAAAQSAEMQWDDPYDQRDAVLVQPPIYTNTGTLAAAGSVTFDQTSTPPLPIFTQGTAYTITETATSGDLDGIVTIFDAANNIIVSQDTGADEIVSFFAPATGQYRIVVTPFAPTAGAFTLTVNRQLGTAGVTSDLNLLVFSTAGAFISARSLTTNNVVNNRPVELGQIASPSGATQIQFLIARGNIPSAAVVRPTRVRWSVRGNGAGGIGPAEYFSYNAVTTKGHATAKGCFGTAAYSVFRANFPELSTSPGPATILFDRNANRLPGPDVREQPRIAAADGGNTGSFGTDTPSDFDANLNFFGTSAAAPHAAALAGLIIQSRGGPGSVTPTQMLTILQNSALPHDLDPSSSSGSAVASDGGGVTITIDSDGDANALTGLNDPNAIKVTYLGPGALTSLTFNPEGTAATAGNATGGNNGYQDNAGSSPATVTYFDNSYPGLVFTPASKAFTLGNLSGLVPADIAVPLAVAPFTGFSNLAPLPSNGVSQFWTMTVNFPTGQFTDSKVMRFTVGRGSQHTSSLSGAIAGNGPTGGTTATGSALADLFGGGVFLPTGQSIANGMTFSGTTSTGATFTGTIKNRVGRGYSPVDGYGFIDISRVISDTIFSNGFE
jgi:hypothetical protein